MNKSGFKDLIVWQESKKLAVEIYKLTTNCKFSKDFSFIDQMRKSAISIPSNIAEGDERSSNKDSVRFFYMAKGSLAELITQLEIAKEISYIDDSQLDSLLYSCESIGKKLGSLIKARSTNL